MPFNPVEREHYMKAIKNFVKRFISPKALYLRRFDIRENDVVIDLGANVGEVSNYFLRKKAHVVAYEPNPFAFEALKQNSANSNARLTLVQSAVSNFNGTSKLWLHQDHAQSEVGYSQGSSLRPEKDNVSKDDFVEVKVIDIKDVLAVHDHIRLLKIDIEGGEYDIIDDVLNNIEKIDYVLLETHENKCAEFAEKSKILYAKIAQSPHKSKFFTDWF